MKKFVFIYNGPQATEAPGDEVMAMWMKWFGELGDKLVDGGNPFGADVREVTASGSKPVTDGRALGYSIVNAESHEAACELAKDCPMLGSEDCSVHVYEALPM
jgi:hypothetical protein